MSCSHAQTTGKCTYKALCFIDEPFYKRKYLSSSRASDFTCTKGIVRMFILYMYLLPSRRGLFVLGWSEFTHTARSSVVTACTETCSVFVCVFLTQTHFNKFSVIHFLFTQGSSLQICLNRGSIGLPPLNN